MVAIPPVRVRDYEDGLTWDGTPVHATIEQAFRQGFVEEARRVVREWVEADDAAFDPWSEVEAAGKLRWRVQERYSIYGPGRAGRRTYHLGYRPGHERPAARLRGRHHALVYVTQSWDEVEDFDAFDHLVLPAWLMAVERWANVPIRPGRVVAPPPRPLEIESAEIVTQEAQRLTARCGDRRVVFGEAAGDDMKQGTSHAVARRIVTVERETLEWLWPGRIPLGKLTLLAGDPGLGKSFVTLDMAARVSKGTAGPDMPLLPQSAGGVVLFSAEDDLADTVAPRLDWMCADDTMIVAVEGVETLGHRRHFSLETDLPRLEEVLDENPNTRLVVIDPIAAYCGKVDSHKNTDVRGLLAPLANLASRRRVAIVAVTHLSKTGGNKAVYRAMGSLAFAAAARAVWAIIKDTSDSQKRLFLPAKLNLANDPDGLAYRIREGRVAWEMEPVKMHADDAISAEAAAAESKPKGTERKEAERWLRERLAAGPLPSREVIEEGKENGFSEITLRRAYKAIGGKAHKAKFDGGWLWRLPGEGDQLHPGEDDQMPTSV